MKSFITLIIVGAMPLVCSGEDLPVYKNSSAPLEQRVEALFQAMTVDERLNLLGCDVALRPD